MLSAPESPDLNPIKLVWGSMKQFLRSSYKPRNLDLVDINATSLSKIHLTPKESYTKNY